MGLMSLEKTTGREAGGGSAWICSGVSLACAGQATVSSTQMPIAARRSFISRTNVTSPNSRCNKNCRPTTGRHQVMTRRHFRAKGSCSQRPLKPQDHFQDFELRVVGGASPDSIFILVSSASKALAPDQSLRLARPFLARRELFCLGDDFRVCHGLWGITYSFTAEAQCKPKSSVFRFPGGTSEGAFSAPVSGRFCWRAISDALSSATQHQLKGPL